MSQSFRRYRKELQQIRLSKDDQQAMRSQLADFIAAHPAPVALEAPTMVFHRLVLSRSFVIGSLVCIVAFSGSGITYASENSLPGSAFYPLKINVLEPIRGAVAVSSEARIQWEVQKVGRRLKEAEKMLGNGSLTAEAGVSLAKRLQDHANSIAEEIAALKAKEKIAAAASASNGFSATLQAHTGLLTQLAQKSKQSENAAQLLTAIELSTETNHDESETIANEVSDDASSETKIEAHSIGKEAEKTINEARKLYTKAAARLDDASKKKLDHYLTQVDTLQAQAYIATQNDRYSDAFVLFQEAHRKAKEAKSILGAKKELKENGHIQLKPETPLAADAKLQPVDASITIGVLTPGVTQNKPKKETRGSRIRNLIPSAVPLDELEIGYKEKDKDKD